SRSKDNTRGARSRYCGKTHKAPACRRSQIHCFGEYGANDGYVYHHRCYARCVASESGSFTKEEVMIFYSPLRYPGGKNKLAKFIAKICERNNINGHYVEPYAG